MSESVKISAIIVAAGSSRRMGFDKLLAPLAGEPVLKRTVAAFAQCDAVAEIIVVTSPERYELVKSAAGEKPIQRVDGGADRHDSVAAGLAASASQYDFVSVHDGARPLITPEQIENVLAEAVEHRAATSARLVTETVKRSNEAGFVTQAVDRDNLWLMETPQIFQAELLKRAYLAVAEKNERVTDEVSALQLIGVATKLVQNPSPNPKITFPHDIAQAEELMK
ncbi:2-C-methyl-D-erythritol 4-phosphate cytidylyltransferase [Persicirhabdus sediminis]|uniref:2-C-methyl-D-erythritol 4-phosphate cytidylyltransferase n=1 Tax=Persicirhabdus sediminis TaxID=454144 RepID=A0A8J7MB14_9BACT|nr:2-C-methyl-D-erythritol 4-phosphate cytidylyltransferase [Persicirhabdus sediminis]